MTDRFMREALKEAREGIANGEGGPFGAVVVRDGVIVGRGHNRVLARRDPTCHGEMEAIRDACARLGTHDLSGCEIHTTAEPCPMCLGAILWANIGVVRYGCSRRDTAGIGFRDDAFYDHLAGRGNLLVMEEEDREACLELFREYAADASQRRY